MPSDEALVTMNAKAAPSIGEGKITPSVINAWEHGCLQYFRDRQIADADKVFKSCMNILNELIRDWYMTDIYRFDGMNFDAFLAELDKLPAGVTDEEVERQKVGLLANTVMSLESTGARAGMNAGDYFARGRVRPVEEIVDAIARVTAADVKRFVAGRPTGPYTIVTIGPHELSVPGAVQTTGEQDAA